MSESIQRARTAKNWTQKELAQVRVVKAVQDDVKGAMVPKTGLLDPRGPLSRQ